MNYEFELERYLEELENIVNIDSWSKDPQGTEEVAKFLKDKYDKLGWITNIIYPEDTSYGPILEIKNTNEENIDILLIGHMDTVFKTGTIKERPYRRDGNLAYGPGIIDMKSGLLNIYFVMEQLIKTGKKLPNIRIIHNSDEEISSVTSRALIEDRARKSRYAFILEPARITGHLVYERKGLAKYRVEFKGKAAHPGVDPENGISAINELGHWIIEIHKLINLEVGTMLNVGVVGGGVQANVIADSAWAEIDLRYIVSDEINRIEARMNELVQNPITKGVTTKLEQIGQRPPMNPSVESKKLFKIAEDIGDKLGVNIEGTKTGGGSDANFTAALGVPTIDGLGPVGGGGHGVGEYIEIDTIEDRVNVLRELILAVGYE